MTNSKPGQQRVRIKGFALRTDDSRIVTRTYTTTKPSALTAKKIAEVSRDLLPPKDHNWNIYVANDPLVLKARERLKGFKPGVGLGLRGFDEPEVLGLPTPKRTRSK